MKNYHFDKNWTTDNNGFPLNGSQVERYLSIVPSDAQYRLSEKPFYCFVHFGMNTATGREWGSGTETVYDFTIKKIKPDQWVKTVKSAGAAGIILTCKHHDGFCLWDTKQTSFSVKNTQMKQDIVKMVSDACRRGGLDFGVYLSPWDMHEKSYGTEAYNDFFCNQLTELLTDYGEISEVWFDGAKGASARYFEYDWERYYQLIRKLQPRANIAVCGPDIRWVGNEGGKTRKSEFSVVPAVLSDAEKTHEKSQQNDRQARQLKKCTSTDEDLGSRAILEQYENLIWYPAEVDVSIRKGWFWSKNENKTVKSPKELFRIYLHSVGNNCTLLLNVPPAANGMIHSRDVRALKGLGNLIRDMTDYPVISERLGKLKNTDGYIDFQFDSVKKLRYVMIREDIRQSQRVEKFDLYIKKANGKWKLIYQGTVIGSRKIIPLKSKSCIGARFLIRQSRSTPVIKEIVFYE